MSRREREKEPANAKKAGKKKNKEHPFFGMRKGEKKSVAKEMDDLRGGRYRGL